MKKDIASELQQGTAKIYDKMVSMARSLFLKKAQDYGSSWSVMRLPSLTDQIWIKAKRIRTLESGKENKVGEDVKLEYMGMINYGVMALILLMKPGFEKVNWGNELLPISEFNASVDEIMLLYDACIAETKALMEAKNHDYGEAWQEMRISSLTDLMLMKLLRIKQIEDNKGATLISEGVKAGYQDIINYAIFALMRLLQEEIRTDNIKQ